MEAVITTSVETATAARRRPDKSAREHNAARALTDGATNGAPVLIRRYRHVAAIHSKSRASTLSHDAAETPSFLGFRNLMVITLGMLPP